MDANDSQFVYTFLPADGTLVACKKRFRVGAQGPQMLTPDGSTATRDPAPGDLLVIPKADDISWFAGANWSSSSPNAGETLPVFVQRIHDQGPESRVLHQQEKAAMVPGYILFDWRNAPVRQNLLVPSGTEIADSPKQELDPTKVQFAGGESVFLPLKALKQHVANVAPGTAGGTAPAAGVDVSDSDLEKLRNALRAIEGAINSVRDVRFRAGAIQLKCTRGLSQLRELRDIAAGTNTQFASDAHPIPDSDLQAFVQVLDVLIDKAAAPLANAPYDTLEPTLSSQTMPNALDFLNTLITQQDTIALLAKIVPSKGDVPWVVGDEPGDSAKTRCTIAHICDLAAACAYWLVECDKVERSDKLMTAAITAMTSGAPPTPSATSLIDFAAAIPFYSDQTLLDSAGAAPQACCGAITQLFAALRTHQSLSTTNPSLAGDAIDKIAAAQGKVLETSGWLSWASDFVKVAKTGFKAWGGMKKAYERAALGKDKDADVAADAAKDAVKTALDSGGGFENLGLAFDVRFRIGAAPTAKALQALEALDTPTIELADEFGTLKVVFDQLGGFGKVGALAFNAALGVHGLGGADGSSAGIADAAKTTVSVVKDTLASLDNLKVVSGLEQKQLALVVGKVSLMFSVALELCAAVEASSAHDAVAKWGHGLLAGSSLLFLLAPLAAGPLGAVLVVLGAAALVIGEGVTLAHSGALDSQLIVAGKQVFPKDGPEGSFEHEFAAAFGLTSEVAAAKAAFAKLPGAS